MRLLVVDDHKMILEGLDKSFKNSKYIQIVKMFTNPFSVLSYLNDNHNKIDGILTDLKISVFDGMELIKTIKKRYPDLKIIVFSTYQSFRLIDELKQLNADGFIHKEANREDLAKVFRLVKKGIKCFPTLPRTLTDYDYRYSKKNRVVDFFIKKYHLSKREMEVFELIIRRYTSKEIAERLFISINTVATHRKNIILKTGYKTNIDFYLLAIEMGIIDMPRN